MERWRFDRPLVVDLTVACLLTVPTVVVTVVADGVSRHAAPIGWPGYVLVAVAALALRRAAAGRCSRWPWPRSPRRLPGRRLPVRPESDRLHGRRLQCRPARPAPRRLVIAAAAPADPARPPAGHRDRLRGGLGVVPVTAWVVVPGALGHGLRLREQAARQARRRRSPARRRRAAAGRAGGPRRRGARPGRDRDAGRHRPAPAAPAARSRPRWRWPRSAAPAAGARRAARRPRRGPRPRPAPARAGPARRSSGRRMADGGVTVRVESTANGGRCPRPSTSPPTGSSRSR